MAKLWSQTQMHVLTTYGNILSSLYDYLSTLRQERYPAKVTI